MVSSKYEEVFRVLDLVGEKQAYCFQRLLAPIDIITEEEVIGFWRETPILEQTEKVIVLTMYISANLQHLLLAW